MGRGRFVGVGVGSGSEYGVRFCGCGRPREFGLFGSFGTFEALGSSGLFGELK